MMLIYVGLYVKYLGKQYLPDTITSSYDTVEASMQWSFYILIGPCVAFLFNILVVFLSGINIEPLLKREGEIYTDNTGDMILY